MEVEIKIDGDYKVPKIVIYTDSVTEDIKALAEKLSSENRQVITAFKDNTVKILDPDEIIRIYSFAGRVAAVTERGEFFLRRRLYELEELLVSKKFVRISNSEIINLKWVKEFDLSASGTICVSLTNLEVTYVSRRYVSKIKKILGI
ncbi:MAG: LytTR family transcriptional regulator [Oscillospiraceae bacterium]|nr:LytTR family transcriptional regulator [Oscillospiraceae bacterium]